MPNYQRTRYYLDVEAVRELFRKERAIRGTTLAVIQEQTGIGQVSLSRFSSSNQTLEANALLTIIKWCNGNLNDYVKRRGTAYKHSDTYEQKQLRNAAAYLKHLGVELEAGESPVDAMLRMLDVAKSNGFMGGDDDE